MNPINPSRRWRLASRRVVAGREIKPQYKSKPNTELSKPNTEHRGVYQKKKKKIPNKQTKIKPSKPLTHGRSRHRRRRRHCSPGHPSSQIEDRRTQIALPLLRCSVFAARCSLRPSVKVFRSFFSLTLSQSLAL